MENIVLTKAQIYFLAARPRTLAAGIAPVFIGSTLAIKIAQFDLLIFLCALLFALLVQIGTNLANDYFDFKQGADTSQRKGPLRVTQSGFLKPQAIKRAYILTFTLAFIVSLYLVYTIGPIYIVLSLLCIFCGIFYTASSYSIAYMGLGEVFVFIFFGPIATISTYFLQTHMINTQIVLSSIPPGLLSTAILLVNNLRDTEEDRKANKKTISVRFGKPITKMLYLFCISIPFCISLLLISTPGFSSLILFTFVALTLAIPCAKNVIAEIDLNLTLEKTAKLLILYSILFCIGALLCCF